MPIRKKNKLRNRIIFLLFVILVIFLTYYVPGRKADDMQYVEREISL